MECRCCCWLDVVFGLVVAVEEEIDLGLAEEACWLPRFLSLMTAMADVVKEPWPLFCLTALPSPLFTSVLRGSEVN